jgi:hypothetical protein
LPNGKGGKTGRPGGIQGIDCKLEAKFDFSAYGFIAQPVGLHEARASHRLRAVAAHNFTTSSSLPCGGTISSVRSESSAPHTAKVRFELNPS